MAFAVVVGLSSYLARQSSAAADSKDSRAPRLQNNGAPSKLQAPPPMKGSQSPASPVDLDGKIVLNSSISTIKLFEISKLSDFFPSAGVLNTLHHGSSYNQIIGEEDFILADIVRKFNDNGFSNAFMRGGPRRHMHFDPATVKAAIVTCGGLCPGLNNVIRETVHALRYLYNVETVLGIR